MNPEQLIESAYDVCSALDAYGIKAVMTGGSAATSYAPRAYLSDDIDFILVFVPVGVPSAKALTEIGFKFSFQGHYERNGVMVDFPKGPLTIGSEVLPNGRYSTHKRDTRVLRVLTPTDAIRNRLESYYAWNDFSARAAAVAIAQTQLNQIDLHEVRSWSLREYARIHAQQRERFDDFLNDLSRRGIACLTNTIPNLNTLT